MIQSLGVLGRGNGFIWRENCKINRLGISDPFSKDNLKISKLRQRRIYLTKEGKVSVFECTFKDCPKQFRLFEPIDANSDGVISETQNHVHKEDLSYTTSSTLGSKREAVEDLILKGVKKPKTIVHLLEDSVNSVTAIQVLLCSIIFITHIYIILF
jgi:hypothetical protein